MVIAVAPGLEEIRDKLMELGYEVVILGEYNYPIDAVIYKGYTPDMSYISTNNTSFNSDSYGILMINAQNKTIEEINYVLKTRLYSPLF